jgi:hypothetical protein
MDRWSAGSEIRELTRQQIAKLLDEASAAPTGSIGRKVADFRAAYLNEAAIETRASRRSSRCWIASIAFGTKRR